MHVAGVALVPHRGDANLRLGHVVLGETHTMEHGLGSALGLGLRDAEVVLVELHWLLHGGGDVNKERERERESRRIIGSEISGRRVWIAL